jgi:hypothetical protein
MQPVSLCPATAATPAQSPRYLTNDEATSYLRLSPAHWKSSV